MKSILEEVRENSLDELFSRDPLSLSDADLDKMIALYREKRAVWAKGEAAKLAAKGAKKTPTAAPEKLSLEDLGL